MLLENIALGKTMEIYVDRDGYRYRLVSKVEKTAEPLNFARRIKYVWYTAARTRCGSGLM